MAADRLEHWLRARALALAAPPPPAPDRPADAALLELALEQQLQRLLFACGDSLRPRAETLALLGALVARHVELLAHLALDAAASGPDSAHCVDGRHVVAALRLQGQAEAAALVAQVLDRRARAEAQHFLLIDFGRVGAASAAAAAPALAGATAGATAGASAGAGVGAPAAAAARGPPAAEEEACFSKREPPPDFLTASALQELRADLAKRGELDAIVAEGRVVSAPTLARGEDISSGSGTEARKARPAKKARGAKRPRAIEEDDDDV